MWRHCLQQFTAAIYSASLVLSRRKATDWGCHTCNAFTRNSPEMQEKDLGSRKEVNLQMSRMRRRWGRELICQVSVQATLCRKGKCWHKHISVRNTHLHAVNILMSQALTHTKHASSLLTTTQSIRSASERWLIPHLRFGWDCFCGVCD